MRDADIEATKVGYFKNLMDSVYQYFKIIQLRKMILTNYTIFTQGSLENKENKDQPCLTSSFVVSGLLENLRAKQFDDAYGKCLFDLDTLQIFWTSTGI